MRKGLMLPCLILTAAALGLYPLLSHFYFTQQAAPPPGIHPRESRLVRIWLVGDMMGADAYLKKQAAAFEKAHQGVRLYLRTARAQELADPEAVLPDGVIFSPGIFPQPEKLLTPLVGSWPIPDRLLMAGKWQGQQYALPLLLGGYVLAEAAEGDAPFQCAPGVPALLAGAGGVASADARQSSQAQVYSDFTARRCRRALLTLKQLRAFEALCAKGKGFAYTAAPMTICCTDLCLAGAVLGDKATEALAFMQFLLAAPAQQALADYGFFPVDPTLALYDAQTPLLAQTQALFAREAALPSLFAYDAARAQALGHSVFFQGANPQRAFEQLQ